MRIYVDWMASDISIIVCMLHVDHSTRVTSIIVSSYMFKIVLRAAVGSDLRE